MVGMRYPIPPTIALTLNALTRHQWEATQKLLEVEKWSPEGDDVALRNIQL